MNYYKLKPPFSKITTLSISSGVVLRCWISGRPAGDLYIPADEASKVILMFANMDWIYAWHDANDKVCWIKPLDPDETLISDNGCLTTLESLQDYRQPQKLKILRGS